MKAVDVTTTDGTRSFFSACSGSARWRGGKVLLTGNHHHVGDMVSFQQPWTAPRYFIKRYLLGQVVTKVCSHVTVVFRHHLLGGVVEEIPSHLYLRSGNFALHGFLSEFFRRVSCLESMINHLVMVQTDKQGITQHMPAQDAPPGLSYVICHMSLWPLWQKRFVYQERFIRAPGELKRVLSCTKLGCEDKYPASYSQV